MFILSYNACKKNHVFKKITSAINTGSCAIISLMKLAITQPYLFPYIGYWQLIAAADRFVLLDDVNYIKKGFINRNRILDGNSPHPFTISLDHPSMNKLIMDSKLSPEPKSRMNFLRLVQDLYRRAPYFDAVYPMIERVMTNSEIDLTDFIFYSIRETASYLEINTDFTKSSLVEKDPTLRGQDRIIAICKKLGADTYINPTGGRELYDQESFAANGMQLYFIDMKYDKVKYKQFTEPFVENLSIIDVMMFNSVEKISEMLKQYELNAQ